MEQKKSLLSTLKSALFSPRQFFEKDFKQLSAQQIYGMSFLCLIFGMITGGALPYFVSIILEKSFTTDPNLYLPSLATLNIDKAEFIEILKIQKSYGILLIILSPIICYMAPHLFGGSLYVSLKLLVRSPEVKLDFFRVMECSAIALCPMAFYGLPIIGPLLAPVMVYIYLSMALRVQYHLVGFMKTMAIIFAMYVCFFLPSASLQLLALPLAKWLNF